MSLPAPEAVAAAASDRPLQHGPPRSALADAGELRYREQIE